MRCKPVELFIIIVTTVNDVIADKNVVTKIMNNSTGLQRIELNGFAKRHCQTGYYLFCIWLVFSPVSRPRLVPIVFRFGVLPILCWCTSCKLVDDNSSTP